MKYLSFILGIILLSACIKKAPTRLVEYEITPNAANVSGTLVVSYTVSDAVQGTDTLHYNGDDASWMITGKNAEPQGDKLSVWRYNGDGNAVSYFFNSSVGTSLTLDAVAIDGFADNVLFEIELNEAVISSTELTQSTQEGSSSRRAHMMGKVK